MSVIMTVVVARDPNGLEQATSDNTGAGHPRGA